MGSAAPPYTARGLCPLVRGEGFSVGLHPIVGRFRTAEVVSAHSVSSRGHPWLVDRCPVISTSIGSDGCAEEFKIKIHAQYVYRFPRFTTLRVRITNRHFDRSTPTANRQRDYDLVLHRDRPGYECAVELAYQYLETKGYPSSVDVKPHEPLSTLSEQYE